MIDNVNLKNSNEKGITLIALIITIVVMLIIVAISVDNGIDSLDSTRLQGFYMQLETIQKRVDDIATTDENYIDSINGTKISLKTDGGSALDSSQKNVLQKNLYAEGIIIPVNELDKFRYFTISNLEEQLGLMELDYDVFIHFDTRTVVAKNGIEINGERYYTLEKSMYYVEQDTSKNQGTLNLEYDIKKYGMNNYKITVIPNSIGDLPTNGTLKYKKTSSKYWETANGLEIIIRDLEQYDIKYVDNNNNTATETITIALDDNDNPIYTVNE